VNERLNPVHGSVELNAAGTVPFAQDRRYVIATGSMGNWTTTLYMGAYFLDPGIQYSLVNRIPIPIANTIQGGRDSVLIAPRHDPTSQEEVDALFSDPARHNHANKYAERIQFTPPELREEIHQRTLDHWPDIQTARNRERMTQGVKRKEPPPTAHNAIWI